MSAKNSNPRSGRGETIAKFGTIVSAIVASSCCWLPLILLAIGVSGAGIAAKMEAYRPAFMVVTFGFLGAAFYCTYRPRPLNKSVDCCDETAPAQSDCCDQQSIAVTDCCAPAGRSRFSMMTLNKGMLWVVTVMAIVFLFFPKYVTSLIAGGGGEITTNMTRTVLLVEGMTCEG